MSPPNPYELAARRAKVKRLIAAIDAHFGHPASADEVREMDDAQLDQLLREADCSGEKSPSDLTIQMVASRIKERG